VIDMERRMEDVIGEVVIKYGEENMGTLALNIHLDLEISNEEMEELQNLVTKINEIIVPAINRKITENK
jgi:hypothetical protein